MAGTFTHWMVVEEALKGFAQKGRSLKIENGELREFVKLGAVSPDLPYLTDPIGDKILKQHNWADRMHYENTGALISHGIELLQPRRETSESIYNKCAAWLCGYTSHVVADTIVHPVVNAIVGPYIFNSDDHRECEMIQDSLVFQKVMGGKELLGSGYHLFLRDKCSVDAKNAPITKGHFIDADIKDFWKSILEENYDTPSARGYYNDIDPDKWFDRYLSGIGFSNTPYPVSRHIGKSVNVAYLKTSEILSDHRKRYFSDVKMPEGIKKSDFFSAVFSKAVQKTVETWDNLVTDIEQGDSKRCLGANGYFKNWNLDLGIDLDNADLWEGKP